jgi:hypothetical protein
MGLAAMAAAVGLAACTSASTPSHGATPSTATGPTATGPTTAGPTITGPSPTTVAPTTTTTVALIPQETPDLAARALLNAWHDGDRHAALVVAVPTAVMALFAQAPEAFSDRGCQQPLNGAASCAFGLGGDAAIAQVQTVSLAGGWVVQAVSIAPND